MRNGGKVEIKKDIEGWKKQIGLDGIQSNAQNEIQFVMSLTSKELAAMDAKQFDEIMLVLGNWFFFLSHEMGTIYARVRHMQNTPSEKLDLERAKLNILKPVHEALKVKIEVFKKVYERKIWEVRNASSSRS